ncbi:MAG: hypothetical protein KIS72_03615 [Luteimonas sp.]|nr:hypothetical protein [Luteimonas sp.]
MAADAHALACAPQRAGGGGGGAGLRRRRVAGLGVPGATRASLLGVGGVVLALVALGTAACGALAQDGAQARRGSSRCRSGCCPRCRALRAHVRADGRLFAVDREGTGMFAILAVLGVLLALAGVLDWRDGDHAARNGGHPPAARLRLAAGLLLAGVPLLALGVASTLGGVPAWLWAVALASLAGILLERRLHLASAPAPVPAAT